MNWAGALHIWMARRWHGPSANTFWLSKRIDLRLASSNSRKFTDSLWIRLSFTLCATHYEELERLETLYPNVQNYHMEVERQEVPQSDANGLHPDRFLYTVREGSVKNHNYGIVAAAAAGLPPVLIQTANAVREALDEAEVKRAATSHNRTRIMR